jgi:hypothetical protein
MIKINACFVSYYNNNNKRQSSFVRVNNTCAQTCFKNFYIISTEHREVIETRTKLFITHVFKVVIRTLCDFNYVDAAT